jgi:hypothetical protein
MVRKSLLKPSIAALVTLFAWWGVLLFVEDALITKMPYEQYRMVALLYPEVFYPGVPGMVLAELLLLVGADILFGGLTFYVGLFGWVVALSVAIGVAAEKYAPAHGLSPSVTAAGSVLALFVAIIIAEAVAFLA